MGEGLPSYKAQVLTSIDALSSYCKKRAFPSIEGKELHGFYLSSLFDLISSYANNLEGLSEEEKQMISWLKEISIKADDATKTKALESLGLNLAEEDFVFLEELSLNLADELMNVNPLRGERENMGLATKIREELLFPLIAKNPAFVDYF